jgi:hypothetical protein
MIPVTGRRREDPANDTGRRQNVTKYGSYAILIT